MNTYAMTMRIGRKRIPGPVYLRGMKQLLRFVWSCRKPLVRGKWWFTVTLDEGPLIDAKRWLKAQTRHVWNSRDPRRKVAAYAVTRRYGGPEDGGWWYNTRDLVAVRYVWRESGVADAIDALSDTYPYTRKRYSVLGGDDYAIMVYDHFEAVPAYESDYRPYC